MEPAIRERRRIGVTGFTLEGEENSPYFLQLWVKLSGRIADIPGRVNPEVLYGVWRKESRDGELRLTYMAGVETGAVAPAPPGMETWDLPPAPCAVFSPRGDMGKIVDFYQSIQEWFEAGAREPAPEGYVMEVYDTRQPLDAGYRVEIWEELAGSSPGPHPAG